VFLLLLIPPGDPLQRRLLVQSRHARLLITGHCAFGNGTRRLCSTSCRNQLKTAAFRTRQAQAAAG
jgi:hypothetical protein